MQYQIPAVAEGAEPLLNACLVDSTADGPSVYPFSCLLNLETVIVFLSFAFSTCQPEKASLRGDNAVTLCEWTDQG